jgi:hypothetical protein
MSTPKQIPILVDLCAPQQDTVTFDDLLQVNFVLLRAQMMVMTTAEFETTAVEFV